MQHTRTVEKHFKNEAVPSMQLIVDDGDYQVRVASNLKSRRKAYQHVYSLYLQKGYAKPHPSFMWLTFFDALPETTTLLIERAGQPIGALTVVFDSPIGLPADSLYKEELDTLRVTGHRLTEFISLGVNDGDARALVKLFNLAYLVTYRLCNATDIMITVNPRHVRYYEKMLLFQKAGSERSYEKVGGAPAVLLRLSEALAEEQIRLEHSPRGLGYPKSRSLYKSFYSEVEEPDLVASLAAARCPMREEELAFFLVDKTNIWSEATADQRAYLNLCYPEGLVQRQMEKTAL
jgi:hypothetical protein